MQPHTRRCVRCQRHRDADDLYAELESTTCLLCENRKASFKAKAQRIAQRIRDNQTHAAAKRGFLSPAERYRRQLQKDSPYSADEIERYVRQRYPEEVHP